MQFYELNLPRGVQSTKCRTQMSVRVKHLVVFHFTAMPEDDFAALFVAFVILNTNESPHNFRAECEKSGTIIPGQGPEI